MTKLFYDHLIIIEDIVVLLDQHNIPKHEQQKLLSVIDEHLEHSILDAILTALPKQLHEDFLKKLSHHPYDPNIMAFLKENTPVDIEHHIFKTAERTKKKILRQIEKSTIL